MNTKKNLIFIIVFIVLFLVVISFLLVRNEAFLMGVLQNKNNSKLNYYAVERLLKVASKDSLVDSILADLNEGVHQERTSSYLTLLGIIGDRRALPTVIALYTKCQNQLENMHCKTIQNYSVMSMGLIGDEEYKFFLDVILKNYDNHKTHVDRQDFAIALYLMSGKEYEYRNDDGVTRELKIWERLETARSIIVKSNQRDRTVEEMVSLYKTF